MLRWLAPIFSRVARPPGDCRRRDEPPTIPSDGGLDALKKRLQETGDDTRERLRSLLTDEQVQRFRDHQDEIIERMGEEVFGT